MKWTSHLCEIFHFTNVIKTFKTISRNDRRRTHPGVFILQRELIIKFENVFFSDSALASFLTFYRSRLDGQTRLAPLQHKAAKLSSRKFFFREKQEPQMLETRRIRKQSLHKMMLVQLKCLKTTYFYRPLKSQQLKEWLSIMQVSIIWWRSLSVRWYTISNARDNFLIELQTIKKTPNSFLILTWKSWWRLTFYPEFTIFKNITYNKSKTV